MSRMLYLAILVAMVLALLVSPAVAAPVDPAGKAAGSGGPSNNYVVRMVGAPVVAYDGGIPGYPATKPGKGQKVDPNDPNVVKYVGFLEGRHNDALNQVGGRALYHYSFSFNGFAARGADRRTGREAGHRSQRAGHRSGPDLRGRHFLDAGIPWPRCAGRAVGATRWCRQSRRWHHHRHHRQRHLAREPEFLRPDRAERQRHQERQAGLPADPRLARQVHAR